MADADTIRNIIITVMISVIVIVGIGNFLGDFAGYPYNKEVNTTFANQSEEFAGEMQDITENMKNRSAKGLDLYSPIGWYKGAKAVFSVLVGSGQLAINFVYDIPSTFGVGYLPSWFFGMVATILLLIVILEIISAIFKHKV